MRYLLSKFALVAGLLIGSHTVSLAKACTGLGFSQDSGTSSIYEVSWYSGGSDCCSPSVGSALVEIHLYVNGNYVGTASYYITTSQAQYAAGCSTGGPMV